MAKQDRFDRLLERWSLHPDDLDVGPQVLGTGSFGEVRAGTLRDGNSSIEVAVKLLPMNGNCEETWNKIGGEAVLLAKVSERCKSTSRLYGICPKDDRFCLVMKKYATSLEKKMGDYPDRKAPRKKVEQWALGICEAVVELHAQNVVIRDLKPSNVLLDEFDGAILADFGISKMVESTVSQHRTSTAVAGTFAYMAPETWTKRVADRSSKVDVWSLGCLLLELHTGKAPWEGLDMANIMYQVLSLKEHPTIPLEMNRDLADALEQCFVYDPIERASAMTILESLNKAYYQAPGDLTNFQDKCHFCSSAGTVATCLQCTSKLDMVQHDMPQSLDSLSRIESLDREVEALTLQKDGVESQLYAAEEKVAVIEMVREVQTSQWRKEKDLLEHKVAQCERLNVHLSKQVSVVDELHQALKDAKDQVFAAEAKIKDQKGYFSMIVFLSSSPQMFNVMKGAIERDLMKGYGIEDTISTTTLRFKDYYEEKELSKLTYLPHGIGKLTALKTLDVRGCSSLEQLPEEISNITSLASLNLSGCSKLKGLPRGIGKLTALKTLYVLYCSSLEQLPEEISNLTSLTYLGLGCCSNLKCLPHSIGKLMALETLDLGSCSNLEQLPEEISNLTSLTYLGVLFCSNLKCLPHSIGKLMALETLDLRSCSNLEQLPEEISDLSSLTSLYLGGCSKLKGLPCGIGKLTALKTLSVIGCKSLEQLPEEISNLTSLTSLDLSGCTKLKVLPHGIRKLKALKTLQVLNCPYLRGFARMLEVDMEWLSIEFY